MGTTVAVRRVALYLLIVSVAAVHLAGTAPLAEELGVLEDLEALNGTTEDVGASVTPEGPTPGPTTTAAQTELPSSGATTTKQQTTAPAQPPTTKLLTTTLLSSKQPTPNPTTTLPPPVVVTTATGGGGGTTALPSGNTTPAAATTTAATTGSFSAVSFVGGIVLGVAIVIIAGFAYSFYKTRRDKNYQTL